MRQKNEQHMLKSEKLLIITEEKEQALDNITRLATIMCLLMSEPQKPIRNDMLEMRTRGSNMDLIGYVKRRFIQKGWSIGSFAFYIPKLIHRRYAMCYLKRLIFNQVHRIREEEEEIVNV